MSLPNLDAVSSTSNSNGFWEIGNYKANVQRIHQGSEQLDELSRFIKERIAIENNYAKHLERWNDEWRHYSDKHLADGSMKRSFDLVLEESRELAKVHSAVKERFNDEVLKTIELFKKDNYHRSAFRGFKEAKELEDEFEKAQKQWKKLFERVESSKRVYHMAARSEKSTHIQFMNSKASDLIADGSSDKIKERYEKCQEDLRKTRTIYEQNVKEITAYNNVYMENMAFVFEKCQQMEMKRLRFALEMLSGMQKILVDLVNPPRLSQIHAKTHQHFLTTTDVAVGEDLKKWSLLHGVDCATRWPKFEEYTGELRHIHGGSAKSKAAGKQLDNGVVLTKKVIKSDDEPTGMAAKNGGARGESGNGFRSYVRDEDAENERREAQPAPFMRKQNSIDSQQSKGTSKSGRSHSEKPPSGHRMSAVISTGAAKRDSHPNGSGMVLLDPLADPFPMVTPQKRAEPEIKRASNGNGIPPQPDYSVEDRHSQNGDSLDGRHGGQQVLAQRNHGAGSLASSKGGQSSSVHSSADNASLREEEHIDLDHLPPPMPLGPARVMYDYKPSEDDEIELVKGDTLDIVSGPDHLGWCMGVKKNGTRGLFPAGFVHPLIDQ